MQSICSTSPWIRPRHQNHRLLYWRHECPCYWCLEILILCRYLQRILFFYLLPLPGTQYYMFPEILFLEGWLIIFNLILHNPEIWQLSPWQTWEGFSPWDLLTQGLLHWCHRHCCEHPAEIPGLGTMGKISNSLWCFIRLSTHHFHSYGVCPRQASVLASRYLLSLCSSWYPAYDH